MFDTFLKLLVHKNSNKNIDIYLSLIRIGVMRSYLKIRGAEKNKLKKKLDIYLSFIINGKNS